MSDRRRRAVAPPTVWLLLSALVLAMVPGLAPAPAVSAGREREAQARARRLQGELALADSLLSAGRAAAVAERVGRILEQIEGDPLYGWQFQERLGVARLRMGDPAAALEILEASARAEPTRPSIHRNLATTLMAMGRRGRALSEYRQALELAPRDCDIRLEFGQVLLGFGNVREAAVHLERARDLCGGRRDVRLALVDLALQERRFDDAAALLADLYAEDPDPQVLRNRQAALLEAGRDGELYGLLRSLPESGLDGQQLQILIEAEGRLGKADFAREQVLRLDDASHPAAPVPLDLPAAREAGFWGAATLNLLAVGDAGTALRAADRAIALQPDQVVYRNNRVVALIRLGREDEARREWARVLELDPSLDGSGDVEQEE